MNPPTLSAHVSQPEYQRHLREFNKCKADMAATLTDLNKRLAGANAQIKNLEESNDRLKRDLNSLKYEVQSLKGKLSK